MQDQAAFHIPEVGYLFPLLSMRNFRIGLVGVPALIIGLVILRRLWREGGDEARRQKLAAQGWRTLDDPASGAVPAPVDAPAVAWPPAATRFALGAAQARLGSASGVGRPHRGGRTRIDLSLPLRVGRLMSARGAGPQGDGQGPRTGLAHSATGDSPATSRLLVTRLNQ